LAATSFSIAKTVDDLKRIDPTVFQVSDTIDQLFRKHYAMGFGFVICCFDEDKGVAGHPIGYVHDLLPDGSLFVPCRHEHGHGTKETEHFSHEIYSLNTKGGEAGKTRSELGYRGGDTSKQVYTIVPKKVIPFTAKPVRQQNGGITTTDIKCLGGCTFFGGISGHCSKCWSQLAPADQAKHTAEQTVAQIERERTAWDRGQEQHMKQIGHPNSESEAIQSEVLGKHVPEIKCLRQRLIKGEFKNDDLVFALA